jgi:hypothetical protein
MLLNLFEVYEEVIHHNKSEGQKHYFLREVVINKRFITFMREDTVTSQYHKDGRLPETLAKDQKFTRISVARGNIGQDIVVVGDLKHITSLFNQEESRKRTLKG